MAVSELLAVGSAACTAGSIMLLGQASGKLGVYRSARLQLASAFVMTALIAWAVTGWKTPEPWQIEFLAASSFFGMVVGNLAYNGTIQTIGPRLTALLFSLTSPFSLVLGYAVLGETITLLQLLGVATVLAGIVLAVGPVRGVGKGLPLIGLGLGVLTAFVQALGMLCARPVMASGVDPFVATTVRAGFAAAVFIGMTPVMWRRGGSGRIGLAPMLQVSASSFFGIVVGMSLMMAALAQGHVGLVTTLAATVPVVILPMIWAVTGKAPSTLAWAGAILSAIGTAIISLAG
jgi:drug/metabolite transporter (DMT)-like permease